jgi:hypothetical protein
MERFNTFGMVSAARRDCAYGQADPGNERSYGQKAEVRVFFISSNYTQDVCWRMITRYAMRAL